MKKNKELDYYLKLPWTYTVEEEVDNDGSKIYIVGVLELPGIKTDAPSLEEAYQLIKEAMIGTFELFIELGKKIPEPQKLNDKKFQGKITYRTTRETHQLLADVAKKNKKPINKVINEYVEMGLGRYAKNK